MNRNLFQALTLSELEIYASELEHAVENHARWLGQVNRALICQLPPDEKDISEAPHRLCHFGRWYHSIDNADLTEVESFARIGEVHRLMHLSAKHLLLTDDAITTEEYDQLIAHAEQLRDLLNLLHDDLSRNRNLVSKLMSKVFQNASEGVVITAPDSTIINVNRAFTEVTGYSEEEAIGNTPKMLQSGIQGQEFYDQMWQELQQYGQWQGEIWNRKKNGEVY
ncbi:MAG TPA: PAS domain-containing protein, partial [Gammaproteobacteria bacterium]